jgi:hypothetical protein
MPKRLILSLLVVLCALAHAEAAGLRPKPHEGYEIKDGKIYFRRGNAGIILEVATTQMIEKYFKDRGGDVGNPFAQLTTGMQNPAFFLVTLLNRTNGSLTFTPRYVIAKIKTEAYFPLDYLTMMEVVEQEQTDRRKLLEKAIYHSPELLHPGAIVSKFLIFPGLPKKFDDLRLSFDYLYFENSEVKSDFFFTTKVSD